MKNKYFVVDVRKYKNNFDFFVYRPASLDKPQNNAVMFLMEKYVDSWKQLLLVSNCLVFWPNSIQVPEILEKKHAIVRCENPRLEYCRFFQENHILNIPVKEKYEIIDGAFICDRTKIGSNTIIMPGAYIGGNVNIGANVFIGSGVNLIGNIKIGDDVTIRENTVIGADGLSTDRDIDGHAMTMPQFGGVEIGNHVSVGANSVIARGAIDNTIISDGCKIDNCVFISHNVYLGKDTFVVGETIMFGGVQTGEKAYISGNATIRNKVKLGSNVFIGMGAVVTKNVEDGLTVFGNPACEKIKK